MEDTTMQRAQMQTMKAEDDMTQNPGFLADRATYHSVIRLIERLHRQFLELIDAELDRLRIVDINNVQSLILFNIGRDEATIGELITRGYYLGSNVSYNVRKLVEADYLIQERSVHDRRSSRVRVAKKGVELYEHFERMFDRHVLSYRDNEPPDQLKDAAEAFRRLGEFWGAQTGYGGRHTF
jgi:DNA-binding MarR family transcriptional regulator